MDKGVATKILTAVLMAALVAACVTTGGAKDEKAVGNALAGWKAALEKQDIDALMAFYSESFTDARGSSKAEVKDFLQGAKDAGYLDGAKVDITAAKTELKDGNATVTPITLSSDRGSLEGTITFKKEGKDWRIISSEFSQ